MFNKLPGDVVNLILKYNGRIKFRKGKYTDQINTDDPKYNKLKEIVNKKQDVYNTIKSYYGLKNPYYIEIYIYDENQMKLGIILDYYYLRDNDFTISMYKDIRSTDEYIKRKAFNRLNGIYQPIGYFVQHYKYK